MKVSSPASNDDTSQAGRAHRLWEVVLENAKQAKAAEQETHFGKGLLFKGDLLGVAASVWPHLASNKGRNSAARSFVAGLVQELKRSGNMVKIGDSYFVRHVYVERANRAAVHPILGVTTTPPEITILDRGKRVWKSARDYCSKAARPTRDVAFEGKTIRFWECDKPLAYFVAQCFPEIQEFVGGKQPIYDFLRSTANAVNVGGKQTDELVGTAIHSWLVRDEWNEGGGEKIFVGVTTTDRDRREAKLTPQEAGEDRSPLPVLVSKATQEAVNDMTAESTAPEAEAEETGIYACEYPGCRRSFERPHNLARHVTSTHKHDKDGKAIRKTAMNVVADTFAALEARDREVEALKAQIADLQVKLVEASKSSEDAVRIELIREVIKRATDGELKPFRAVAEIEDALG